MLTREANERLTRVGRKTPMGNLLRRYWFPVAATVQLDDNPVMAISLLGEQLVLFRTVSGEFGLLEKTCPHRGCSLVYGIPEPEGLRCAYHGWLFDARGRCLEQPAEPMGGTFGGTFKERVQAKHYPVREHGGLVFAYLGPDPAPLLPSYEGLSWQGASRQIMGTLCPCNWLQAMENLLDPFHVDSLHGRFFDYVLQQGESQSQDYFARYAPAKIKKLAFDSFNGGLIERKMYKNGKESTWTVGVSTFLPTTTILPLSKTEIAIHFVVPLDDTHTWFVVYVAKKFSNRTDAEPDSFQDVKGIDDDGAFLLDTAHGQDFMALVTQGSVADRELEHLGASDEGIILYRRLLMEQVERIERGGDPVNLSYGQPSESFDGFMPIPLPRPDRTPGATAAF